MVNVNAKVTEGELKEPEWWLQYWKKNAAWLVIRLEQYMNGEDVSGTIKATLPVLKRQLEGDYGHQ